MLALLKQDEIEIFAVKMPAWQPTVVRSDLWAQTVAPQADWAEANPERLMTYLMVAQSDFSELDNVLG